MSQNNGVGVVIDFPFRFSGGRLARTASVETLLANKIRSVLSTYPGERVLRPAYGVPIADLVWSSPDEGVRGGLQQVMEHELRNEVPGASIEAIDVRYPGEYVEIDVRWSVSGVSGAVVVRSNL